VPVERWAWGATTAVTCSDECKFEFWSDMMTGARNGVEIKLCARPGCFRLVSQPENHTCSRECLARLRNGNRPNQKTALTDRDKDQAKPWGRYSDDIRTIEARQIFMEESQRGAV
jgi:hypothetical protein